MGWKDAPTVEQAKGGWQSAPTVEPVKTERDRGVLGLPLMTPGIDRNPIADAISGLEAGGGVSAADEASGWERNVLLPRAVNPETGEQKWAVPGLIQGTYDAAKRALALPGDVLQNDSVTVTDDGRVSPLTDEQVGTAAEAAALATLPTTAGVRQKVGGELSDDIAKAGRELMTSAERLPVTVEGAHRAATAGYKDVWGSSAVVSEQAMSILRHDLRQFASDEGLILPSGKLVDDYPRVRSALGALDEFAAAPLDMKSARTFHRQLRRAAKSTDPEEAFIGAKMLDQFEDWMGSLPDQAFTRGEGGKIAETLLKAKGDWHTYKKGQTIADAIASARRKAQKFSGSGFENALRNEFDKLAGNAKKMRYFNAVEREFIEAVQKGTPLANALRYLGKFAPAGTVGTTLSAILGFNIGGLAGSGALLGTGWLGRLAATRETKKAADAALDAVLNGPTAKMGPTRSIPTTVPDALRVAPQVYGREETVRRSEDAIGDALRRPARTRLSL